MDSQEEMEEGNLNKYKKMNRLESQEDEIDWKSCEPERCFEETLGTFLADKR